MTHSIHILSTSEELSRHRMDWAPQASHPFSHPGLLLDLCDADENIIHPIAAMALDESGRILALLVGRVEDTEALQTSAYLPFRKPVVRQLVIAHGGFMGPERAKLAPELLNALITELDGGIASILELPVMDSDDPVREALLQAGNPRFDRATTSESVRWTLEIENDFETQLKQLGRSTRGKIRNQLNRFNREFENRFELQYLTSEDSTPEQLDAYFHDMIKVEDKSYHRGLGWGVSDTPRERAIHNASVREGWFASAMLRIDDKPAAFAAGIRMNGMIYGTNTAFVPDLTTLSLGTIMFFETLRGICGREGFQAWDFGPGDAQYKSRICTNQVPTEQRTIFSKKLGARLLKARITSTKNALGFLKAASERVGVENKLKKAMRNRVRGRSQS